MWEYSPQNCQNWYFSINLPKGVYSLNRFCYKIWFGEGVPGLHLRAKFHRCGYKITKNGNFLYKFAPKGKLWGSTEKLEYRCTTTNLPACNNTVIVLKILLLHSVSVITNFVIPKRDKQTNKQTKNITLFRLQPARDPRSPPYLAW